MPAELQEKMEDLFKNLRPEDQEGIMTAVEIGLTLLTEAFEQEVAKTKEAKEVIDEKAAMLD